MKVLHVVQGLSRKLGGPQTVLLELTRAQAAAGIEPHVITTNMDAPRGVLAVPTGCPVVVDGVRFLYFPTEFRPLLVSRQLKAFVDRHIDDYDIVHIHGLYRFPMTYAAYAARRRGVPYIIRPYGSLNPYLYNQSAYSLPLKRLYERLFELPNLHGATRIHFTAEMERASASFLKLRTPSFVVPNGVDWEKFRTLPPRGRFRAQRGFGDRPLVLFLGRLSFVKGLDILIPAFDRVRKEFPNAQLALVGPENDDYGKNVRRWVSERGLEGAVHFIGHLDGADVIQAYVDADVFASPSYSEGFGMTVVEAMACGVPVVISDQVSIHDSVKRAGAGLVAPCEPGAVADAVCTLMRSRERRTETGGAGRILVEHDFTWPAIVRNLSREYDALVGERGHDGMSPQCGGRSRPQRATRPVRADCT